MRVHVAFSPDEAASAPTGIVTRDVVPVSPACAAAAAEITL
jgi:hypothetical protein